MLCLEIFQLPDFIHCSACLNLLPNTVFASTMFLNLETYKTISHRQTHQSSPRLLFSLSSRPSTKPLVQDLQLANPKCGNLPSTPPPSLPPSLPLPSSPHSYHIHNPKHLISTPSRKRGLGAESEYVSRFSRHRHVLVQQNEEI